MKKMLMVFIIGLFVACGLMAQAPGDTLWTRTYGQPDMVMDVAFSVQQTTDGGYIVGGLTWNLITYAANFYLVKTNSNGDTLWTRTYGGTSDAAYSVQQTTDEGYIVGGITNQMGNTDIYLVKTNSNGDTLWTQTYGGNSAEGDYDKGMDVKQTNDGGYIITTGTTSYGAGDYDFYLIRTDSNGDTLWTRVYGGEGLDKSYSVQQTTDDGFIIAGTTRSFGGGDFNFYVVKTDSNGDTLWTRTYGGLMLDICYSVKQTTDGGYVIAGRTRSFGAGGSDFYMVKTDSNGDTLWTRTYGGAMDDFGWSVQQTTDDGFVFAGHSASFGMGGNDFYVVRTDSNGDTLWTRAYGGFPDDESAYSVDKVTDGGFIVAGGKYNPPIVFGDIWLVRIAGEGTQLNPPQNLFVTDEGYATWNVPAFRDLIGYNVYLDDVFLEYTTELFYQYTGLTNGQTYLAGVSAVYDEGESEIVEFEFTYTGIGIDDNNTIFTTNLTGNYPNPFNPETTISFDISKTGDVFIDVYNIKGQKVKTLINERLEAGNHQVVWDGKDEGGKKLSSGIYFYQIETPNFKSQIKKMIILR